jgi:hypothetical protein
MQTTITPLDNKITVSGPYSEENNRVWRELGGKFGNGSWTLPDTGTSRARLAELFGSKSEEVSVLVPYDRIPVKGATCQIGGYVLASRRGRDYRVQMPDGVSLAAGTFRSSGGSVKNPSVSLDNDAVFRLRCRRSFAEANNLESVPTDSTPSIDI